VDKGMEYEPGRYSIGGVMSEQTKAAGKSDSLPAAEVKRLSARSETQKVYSNAYVEIEMRAAGLAQGKRNPSEAQGTRVAQEDAKTLPHVWKWEKPIALSAIERNIQNNPAYEREIKRQMPEISREITANREASKAAANNPYQEGKRQVQQGVVQIKNEATASNANSQKKGRSL
jgi:hypothetical protein